MSFAWPYAVETGSSSVTKTDSGVYVSTNGRVHTTTTGATTKAYTA